MRPGSLGGVAAVALVAGNMIGSGIFVMPASLADAAGPLSLVALALVAVGFLALTGVFAELGNAYPISGGPPAFVAEALGPIPGFVAAFLYWLCCVIGNAAFITAFVGYAAVFVPMLKEPIWAFLCAQLLLWSLVVVNAAGVREAGAVQVTTTILKVLPLIVLAFALVPHADLANLEPFAPKGTAALLPAVSLCTWLFLGSESITVPGEEVKGSGATIRRAAYLGFTIATVVYLVVALVVALAIPSSSLAGDAAPLARAGRLALGPWGESFVTVGALISIVGVLNGWLLVTARAPLSAARSGIGPRFLANPVAALVTSSVMTGALASLYFVDELLDAYNFIALFATATSLVAIGGACIAVFVLIKRSPEKFSPASRVRASIAAVVGLVLVVSMIAGSGGRVIGWTTVATIVPLLWALVRRRPGTAS